MFAAPEHSTPRQRILLSLVAVALAMVMASPLSAAPDACDWLSSALQQRFSLDGPVRIEGCRLALDDAARASIERARFDGGATLHLVIRHGHRRLPVTVRAWTEAPVWIAARNLAAGTVLVGADVRPGRALLPLAEALSPLPPLTRGWRVARRIPLGETILARDLRSGNEIASGDVCEIAFQRGAVQVRTRAVVRQVLRGGQVLSLERTDTRGRIRVSPDAEIRIVECQGGTG